MPFPMMPPSMPPAGAPPVSGDAMNLGSPMSAPMSPTMTPPMPDPLASIKSKLNMGKSSKSLPGVGFKKPVGKVAKKVMSSVHGLKRKMAKKGKK